MNLLDFENHEIPRVPRVEENRCKLLLLKVFSYSYLSRFSQTSCRVSTGTSEELESDPGGLFYISAHLVVNN